MRRWLVAMVALGAACSSFKGQEASDAGASDAPTGDVGVGDAAPGDAPSSHDAEAGTADTSVTADTGAPEAGGGDGPPPGTIETVVGGLHQATLVVLDTTNVYFGDEGTTTGVVYQCAKGGCATPTTLGPGFATGIGVDGKNVYWNDFAGGKVVACAIGGCANTPTTIAPTQPQAEGVTFDGTNLYWATSGNVLTCVPPACSPRTQLASGQGTIVHVASETGAAYWVSGGALVSCSAGGCSSTPVKVGSPASGASVFVLNGVAYFTSGNAVVSCPVGGCATPHTIGASDDPYGIGSDGTDVYWLDDIDQVVYRCPVSGCNGGAEKFATGQLSQPGANVALDGEYAYWTVPDQVLRKHK